MKTKRTVDARPEIREPRTDGNCDYDFITLPNCHAERAAVSQKGTWLKRPLTCEERPAMMQIRIPNIWTTTWPQKLRGVNGTRKSTHIGKEDI